MDSKQQLLNKMRAAEFRENNGYVLRVINIMRHSYEKLASVKSALEDLDEGSFLDSVNFLSEEGYIRLRGITGKAETSLADADYRDLEAKVTAKGIRLLGGDLACTERTTAGSVYYTLLERRTLLEGGGLTIRKWLYRSENSGWMGKEVPLNTLPQYAGLKPELTLAGIESIGLARLKTPLFNTVDGSAEGVAVYAPAEGLIRNIDKNEWQLGREFELGRSRIIASEEMLKWDAENHRYLEDDLFTVSSEGSSEVGITVFSPTLREQSYLARKNEYLRNVENLIGLKRGILSEVEAAERTATEITSSLSGCVGDNASHTHGYLRQAGAAVPKMERRHRPPKGPSGGVGEWDFIRRRQGVGAAYADGAGGHAAA